jgi:predicted NUDIX family NTP pyrophosphohydrolase
MKRACGLLLHRSNDGVTEVFLVHPGGPFWAARDLGAWSIPKGEPEPGEDDLTAARRELLEETGFEVAGPFVDLGEVTQRAGKHVHAFACLADVDPTRLRSNTCVIEWPPRSRRSLEIPEVDRGAWFPLAEARERMMPAQLPFLDRLSDSARR